MTARNPNARPIMKINREYHGMSRTRLYYIWRDMRRRCYTAKHISYPWYGGKGMRVCPEWFFSFIAFKSWALSHGYSDNLTIDRKDSSKDYSPANCQWLTKSQNVSRAMKGRKRARAGAEA